MCLTGDGSLGLWSGSALERILEKDMTLRLGVLVGGAGALRTDAPDGECCGAGVLLEAVAAEAMGCRTLGEAIV